MPDAAVACLSSILLEIHEASSTERLEELIAAGDARLFELHERQLLSHTGLRQIQDLLELHRAQRSVQLEMPPPSEPVKNGHGHLPADASLLTGREIEILGWVAQGKRDRQIAELLGISAKTVSKHLENILAKLQVEHRTAAAAWLLRPSPVPGPVEAPAAAR